MAVLTSGYGTGLSLKQKRAVNIVQSPFIELGATWGAGAIGTEIAPWTKIIQVGEEIITEIKLDLTGLFAKGGAGGEVEKLVKTFTWVRS